MAISHSALSMTSILQMIFIMIILGLMFNIFTTIRNREEELDKKILATHTLSQVKNTYLANVSHDIQLLTNSFVGYVQMSLETCAVCTVCQEKKAHPEVPQAMGEALGHVEPLNHYLLSLIQSMLRVNSMDEGTITLRETHTDLNRTMKQIRNIFSALMEEKHIIFRVDNQIEDALVKCDEERLLRLLMNLISNAYHASGEGNKVTVTLRQLGPGYHPEGGGRWHRRQTCVDYELTVKDTGQGMPPTLAGRLQELLDMDSAPTFSTLLDMGRGMYVVKTIVNRMGGTINFTTDPNTGTEFKIQLTFAISRPEDNEA
jgi:signal transduction histidine kinase